MAEEQKEVNNKRQLWIVNCYVKCSLKNCQRLVSII